ncbi:50S ribosomal protein L11 methyltransferase [Alkalihalobacterium bogoriense]|uniref:50S ribosomal protein L11 methyltransferase n=1 Tax=Alkalihalobacterium bogoriense TaxID=246272 RepID=UPI000479FDAF|nr:50S ribosomal protein L11 methyltransferase [Alkalihalobacterium bogoriense]
MLHEYKIKVNVNDIELIQNELLLVGIYNFYYEEPFEVEVNENGYGVKTEVENATVEFFIYGDPNEVPNLPESYFRQITSALKITKEDITYNVVKDEWETEFPTVDLKDGWKIVYPPFSHITGEKEILFDPQGAFGTGIHGTTQHCLNAIVKRDFHGEEVLDLGTGSGILAIAAAIKGAKHIDAIDIQPVQREIEHQCKLNDVNQISVHEADLQKELPVAKQQYDWVFINIGTDETIALCQLHQLLKQRSKFLISGIVEWSEGKVTQFFHEGGYSVIDRLQQDEWVTFVFEKKR